MGKGYSFMYSAKPEVFAQAPKSVQRKPASPAVVKPKLVLAIIVDQFRYDYVLRFGSDYKEGIQQLLVKGAVFTNARYNHFPTFTSVGHAAFLTGAFPSITGIVGNQWYDRSSGKVVRSTSDDSVQLLGGTGGTGSSPRNLLVSTVGDEMKMSNPRQSRVIGISIKDYSAILATGHTADGAYWFDGRSGDFVSSTHYFPDLPEWVKKFNAGRPADRYKGAEWGGNRLPVEIGTKLYATIPGSPFGNSMIEEMAEAAVNGEKLGQHTSPDLLFLSFSSNDYVGHQYGPDSPQVREISISTDLLLGKLFRFLDSHLGMSNVLVVFAADHGIGPMPEANAARKMPGEFLDFAPMRDAVQKALTGKFGEGRWIAATPEEAIYLNWDLIKSRKLTLSEVYREAEQALIAMPHVFRVYTRDRLLSGYAMSDQLGRRVMNSFSASRGADLYVVLDPYYLFGRISANHGTPHGYDTHVPVIFMGPGIKAGRYHASIEINDIAPTLATILGIEIPSGSEGRILSEIFAAP
jgi:predicted AlkP superfamily pyrophosphatase or phosphodiesterase